MLEYDARHALRGSETPPLRAGGFKIAIPYSSLLEIKPREGAPITVFPELYNLI